MNSILKPIVYAILLIISAGGGLVATIFGFVGLTLAAAAVIKMDFGYNQISYIVFGFFWLLLELLDKGFLIL